MRHRRLDRGNLASSRVPSLAWRPVTAVAKRRQGNCRPERGRPHRLHLKGCRGAGTGSPSPRPWTSHLASDGANRRCSDGTAGRRQRSAGGWTARSRSVSCSTAEAGELRPRDPVEGRGHRQVAPLEGKTANTPRLGASTVSTSTTTDSRTGQTSRRDGGGHRLASWTSGYATARSEAVCRGAGCGRTRTSGSVARGGPGTRSATTLVYPTLSVGAEAGDRLRRPGARVSNDPGLPDPVAEHLLDRRSQALAPIENHQQTLRRIETAVDQRTKEGRQDLRGLRVRLHEAKEAFLP